MKYLFVGPVIHPVHGQSLAFTRFIESIDKESKIIINTNIDDKSKPVKFLYTFKILSEILIKSIFCKYNTVYFTCSRSIMGSIKDILLINLASLKNVKIINHLHGSDFYDFLHKSPNCYKQILIHSYRKVDTSIVLLERMKSQFKNFENMKVEVVPNFYDDELEHKLIDKEVDKVNLVYLSNIMCSKGIFELLAAFKEVVKKHQNIHLNIAGGFIADKHMSIEDVKEKFLAEIKSSANISYVGTVFGDKKIKLLQLSDIFILPTYYESEAFPISILEAMVCENAIITTDYKYLPDIISNQNGLLTKPKSITSLSKAIELLLSDKVKLRYIQAHNKSIAKQSYNLDSYLYKLKKIIN